MDRKADGLPNPRTNTNGVWGQRGKGGKKVGDLTASSCARCWYRSGLGRPPASLSRSDDKGKGACNMQTMQDKLTEEFRRLAEGEAGLEFVTDPRGTSGIWYVMDRLDTRMVISYKFEQDRVDMSLIGQAVKEPDLDFFKARQLYSRFGGSPFEGLQVRGPDRTRTLLLIAAYRDGKGLRRMLGVVRDLLAPYAKNSGAQAPQSP